MTQASARILKAGALYFALVFGVGFVLGTLRVLWMVPRFGERSSELVEAPIMLLVTIFAARWVVRRLAVPPLLLQRVSVGFVALALLLAAELAVVLLIRGVTLGEYIASRDPGSGSVYLALLAIYALMPLLVARRRHGR